MCHYSHMALGSPSGQCIWYILAHRHLWSSHALWHKQFDFVVHLIFQASNWQELWIKPPDIRGPTSLLVATLLKLMLSLLLSVTAINHTHFFAILLKNVQSHGCWDANIRPQFVDFFVSHQVFYLHPMQAGSLSLANRYFSQKNSTNMMSGGSIHYTRALLDAVQ